MPCRLRLLAGLVGVVLALVAASTRRFLDNDAALADLRNGLTGAFAAVALLVSATVLGAVCVDLAVQHGAGGVGFYLTGALAAMLVAAPCILFARHHLRRLPPWRLTQAVQAS